MTSCVDFESLDQCNAFGFVEAAAFTTVDSGLRKCYTASQDCGCLGGHIGIAAPADLW